MLLNVYEHEGIPPIEQLRLPAGALEITQDTQEYFVIGFLHADFAQRQYYGQTLTGHALRTCWGELNAAERHRTQSKARAVLTRYIKYSQAVLMTDAEIYRVEVTQ